MKLSTLIPVLKMGSSKVAESNEEKADVLNAVFPDAYLSKTMV